MLGIRVESVGNEVRPEVLWQVKHVA